MVTTVAPTADASKFFHLPSTAPALRREASPWAFLTSTMHAPSKGLSPVLLTILPTSCMFPGEIGKSVFLACSGLSLWWRMWLTPGGNKWHGPLNGYTCWKPLLYFFLLLHFWILPFSFPPKASLISHENNRLWLSRYLDALLGEFRDIHIVKCLFPNEDVLFSMGTSSADTSFFLHWSDVSP